MQASKIEKKCKLKWNFVLTIRETLDVKNSVSLVETSSTVKGSFRVFILNFEKKEKKTTKNHASWSNSSSK